MMGRPYCASAISVPNSGTPEMKDLVPSIGSSTQTNSASSRSLPNSSPMMPCSGNCALISCRIAVSAARSATVTGDRSALSSTVRFWRKWGRIAARAASARLAASARNRSIAATFLLLQAFQIGDHVGPVLLLRHPRERHLGAFGEVLRLVEPDIELVRIPLLVLVGGQRRRELIARYCRDLLLHDAEQVRPDLVGLALVEGMALQADLGELLAFLRVG